MAVNQQLCFELQERENPNRTGLKNTGDSRAHITEKDRGEESFRADLVQRFSDAAPLQRLVSFPLSVLPSKAPALPQGWLPSWCQSGYRNSKLCWYLPWCPRERTSLLAALSKEEENFFSYGPDHWHLSLLGHIVSRLHLWIIILIISGQARPTQSRWATMGRGRYLKKILGIARVLARQLTDKCI